MAVVMRGQAGIDERGTRDEMKEVYVPNSVNLRNFDSLFKENDFDLANGNRVLFRFHPKMVALHPVALAFYAALGAQLQSAGLEVEIDLNKEIHTVPFLQRMGLFRLLGVDDPLEFQKHEETGRFIPLMRIASSAELEKFLKTVDPILHTTQENSRVIKHVFGELLRNTIEHAGAAGFVCATYNRKRKKVSIGIADPGWGIRKTMKRFHPVSSHQAALAKALTPGVTGTTSRIGGTPDNAGAGLFFTKCIAQSTRNHFLIYSGDAYFKLLLTPAAKEIEYHSNPDDDRANFKEGLPYFQGTLVGIDLHTEDTAAFNRLMDRIGNAYAAAVKKSKKDYYKRIRFT